MSEDTFSSDHFVTINGIEIRGGVPNATITIKSKEADPIYDILKSFATEHGIECVPMKIEDSRIIIKRKEDNTDDLRIIDNNDWIEDC